MQIKIHEAYRKIVALADTDLIGKTFTEDIKQIFINPNFYKDQEKTKEEIVEILKDMQKEDATFNIVGKESIECALKAGVIDKEGIFYIDGVPLALGLL